MTPQFKRMIMCLENARTLWEQGDQEYARRLLRLVGSIALAEAHEPSPHDPVPEAPPRPPDARTAAPEAGAPNDTGETRNAASAALRGRK